MEACVQGAHQRTLVFEALHEVEHHLHSLENVVQTLGKKALVGKNGASPLSDADAQDVKEESVVNREIGLFVEFNPWLPLRTCTPSGWR